MLPPAPDGGPRSLTVLRQYIKDLSFESPRLAAFRSMPPPQHQEISLGINILRTEADIFEVSLIVRGNERRGEVVGYIVELIYAGLFRLTGLAPEHRDAVLHIEAPELLFPSARKILVNLLEANQFPFRMSATFDFVGRYAEDLARGRRPSRVSVEPSLPA